MENNATDEYHESVVTVPFVGHFQVTVRHDPAATDDELFEQAAELLSAVVLEIVNDAFNVVDDWEYEWAPQIHQGGGVNLTGQPFKFSVEGIE